MCCDADQPLRTTTRRPKQLTTHMEHRSSACSESWNTTSSLQYWVILPTGSMAHAPFDFLLLFLLGGELKTHYPGTALLHSELEPRQLPETRASISTTSATLSCLTWCPETSLSVTRPALICLQSDPNFVLVLMRTPISSWILPIRERSVDRPSIWGQVHLVAVSEPTFSSRARSSFSYSASWDARYYGYKPAPFHHGLSSNSW